MSSYEPEKRKKRTYNYNFNDEWEEKYFFINFKNKCVCLICGSTVSVGKKSNIERHFTTVHKKYDTEYPSNSNLRKCKVKELKSALVAQQSMFTKSANKMKVATIASFKVAHMLAIHKKPFEDGNIIKEAMLAASEILFQEAKNKNEIMSAIQDVQLSRNSVTRRIEAMSENVRGQVKDDLQKCVFLSLQCDESTDICNVAQVNIFIRMVFNDCSVKEDILSVLPLKGNTRGVDIYQAIKNHITEINLPLQKLVSITTDGAPSMIGSAVGFITLCKNDAEFPNFFNYHCIIHQQALCTKVLRYEHVMKVVLKIVNSIRARPLQSRLFKVLTDELDAEYGTLMLHSEIRWLSKGKVLQRFLELLPEIKQFLESRNETYEELNDHSWLSDLAFLTDITTKMNKLNLELQGKEKTIIELIGSINAFKSKLNLWISQIKECNFRHFTNLENYIKKYKKIETIKYSDHLVELKNNFEIRFSDFRKIQPIALFISNPFVDTNISEISQQIANMLNKNSSDLEMEIIDFQSDLQLKTRISQTDFWILVDEKKYPLLKETFQRLNSCFGSTYLCESGFSTMNLLKSKFRSRITNEHLNDCMNLAITSYVPEYKKLAEDMQCQVSH